MTFSVEKKNKTKCWRFFVHFFSFVIFLLSSSFLAISHLIFASVQVNGDVAVEFYKNLLGLLHSVMYIECMTDGIEDDTLHESMPFFVRFSVLSSMSSRKLCFDREKMIVPITSVTIVIIWTITTIIKINRPFNTVFFPLAQLFPMPHGMVFVHDADRDTHQ